MSYRTRLDSIYEAFLEANPSVPRMSADEAQMELRWEIEPQLNRRANGTAENPGSLAACRAADRCREQQVWLSRFIRVWWRMEERERKQWMEAV